MELKLDYLNEIAGGDTVFINEILETYLHEMPKDVQALRLSIKNKDLPNVQKVAHKMKSSFRLLGLSELYQTSLNLETAAKQKIADWNIHEQTFKNLESATEASLAIVQNTIRPSK